MVNADCRIFETFPGEPVTWTDIDFTAFVKWATDLRMSDLVVQSQDYAWIRVDGEWKKATKRRIPTNQLMALLDIISHNSTASSTLRSKGVDINFAYEIKKSREVRLRYRGNATAIAEGYGVGVRIVLRSIPETPPRIEELNIEPDLLASAFPQNGLVLVTGVMGSGKSTLISALLRKIVENGGKHITTYEDPVEFDLTSIPDRNGPVSQSQIPQHISTFISGIRNSTRSAPNVVLIGEARDPETLRGMIQSAETGVTAYSTVHTPSVPQTLSRIINVFPVNEQLQIAASLLSSLRLVVSQRLFLRADKDEGRIALREYLAFSSKIRETLLQTPLEQQIQKTEELLFEAGQPIQAVAQKYYDEGKLRKPDYLSIMAERKNVL